MTIKDIARESGYSVGTVSRVLNDRPEVSDRARERIMEVVNKYHFRLNSNAKLLKQRTNVGVALLVKGRHNLFFSAMVELLQVLIKAKGYYCFIYYIDEDGDEVEEAITILRERRPKGFMFLGSAEDNFLRSWKAIDVPGVLVTNSGAALGFQNLSSVSTDDQAAARTAVEQLLAMGHTAIGVIGGKMERSPAACARFLGVSQAFLHADLLFEPDRQYASARFDLSGGYQAMSSLLDLTPDLTAVFCMSDVQAVGAIRAARDRGLRVPEDISVAGFDGIELGRYLSPQLSTVRQDMDAIAHRSVEQLLAAIEDDAPAIHEMIPFQLVEGESVVAKT